MPRRKQPDDGGGSSMDWVSTIILGATAAAAIAVGYLVGKEEGREAAAAEAEATSSSSKSSPPAIVQADSYSQEGKENTEERHTCSVCLDQPANIVFVDCGHHTCCRDCAKQLRECPVCRKAIKKAPIQVYKV